VAEASWISLKPASKAAEQLNRMGARESPVSTKPTLPLSSRSSRQSMNMSAAVQPSSPPAAALGMCAESQTRLKPILA
jgi:hypothetical protein